MAKSMRWLLTPSWTPIKLNRTATTGYCAHLTLQKMGLHFSTTHSHWANHTSSHMQILASKANIIRSHNSVYANRVDRYHIVNNTFFINKGCFFLFGSLSCSSCAKRFQTGLQPGLFRLYDTHKLAKPPGGSVLRSIWYISSNKGGIHSDNSFGQFPGEMIRF